MTSNYWINKGFELLDGAFKYRRVDANVLMLSAALHAETGPVTAEVLRQVFERIKSKFAINADYSSAYRTFFEGHPEFRMEANRVILDSTLAQAGLSVTAENLDDLVQVGNPRNVLHQLSITAEAQQARDDAQRSKELMEHQAQETNRMIEEITGYMCDERGRVKFEYQREYKGKIAGLRSLPFADLVSRYEAVMMARAQRKAPIEVVRAQVIAEDVQRKAESLPDVEPLINPETKQPFTGRKELTKYLNSLSRTDLRAFFYFPVSGQPRPGVEQAVQQILNTREVR